MEYENTAAKYDPTLAHYSTVKKVIYILLWLALTPFLLPILMVILLKMANVLTSLFPWPWELFKKGAWVGNCPVCAETLYFSAKPTLKEVDGLSCECGAECRLTNGDTLVYKNKY
jgi:hypothetical protein